jgi:peroxiredoxin
MNSTIASPPFRSHDLSPLIKTKNIHEAAVEVPDPSGKIVHLQFRRFAGCPICNLHLQSFVQHHAALQNAGIREIVIFHAGAQALLPYQGNFPFDVIGDPQKALYKRFGVGSSLRSVFRPESWPASVKGVLQKKRPKLTFEGGVLGLPADFLIAADGTIIDSHYGKHADDQWSIDDVLAKAECRNRRSVALRIGGALRGDHH